MRACIILLAIFFIHTWSLWTTDFLAGRSYGDNLAHAAMPEWYCAKVATWNLFENRYYAPAGVDLSTNFDSPFPLILTCPFASLGGHIQFHIFVAIQIILIVLSSLLVARTMTVSWQWQCAYVLFAWFTGFYFSQSDEHFTLLSGVWGFQLMLWCFLTGDLRRRGGSILRGALLGLACAGTFHNIAMLSIPCLVMSAILLFKERPIGRPKIYNGLLAVGSFTFVFGYLFLPSILRYLRGDLVDLGGTRGFYSADLLAFFMPAFSSSFYAWYAKLSMPFEIVTHFERINSLDVLVWIPLFLSLLNRRFWRQPTNIALFMMSVLFLFLAWGPVIKTQDYEIITNPIGHLLSVFPLSLSHNPGRLLLVSVLSLTYLAFSIAHSLWSTKAWFNIAGASLIFWAMLTGPVVNGSVFVPTIDLEPLLPEKGLDAIRSDRAGSIVATLPFAQIEDASQNYLQLRHGKPITAGYLAYTAYPKPKSLIPKPPYFDPQSCGQSISFLTPDWTYVRQDLQRNGIRHMVLNKRLLGADSCTALRNWVNQLGLQPWVAKIDENSFFVILQVD